MLTLSPLQSHAQSTLNNVRLKSNVVQPTLKQKRPAINKEAFQFMQGFKKSVVKSVTAAEDKSLALSSKSTIRPLALSKGKQAVYTAPGSRTIYGEVMGNGVASFTTAAPETFNYLLKSSDYGNLDASGGGLITPDSVYHCLKNYYNMFLVYQEYNVFTGEMLTSGGPEDMGLVSTDLAVDPATDEVYGAFFNSTKTAMELGVMNYKANTRSTIGTLAKPILVLGCTSTGQLYGISSDGNLYKIDKTNGEETLVGATGVKVSADGNSSYQQSGEIDPTTDIFYWASLDPDGKSALYQVDLTTGEATKLVDYADGTEIIALSFLEQVDPQAPQAATDLKAVFEGASLSGVCSFTFPTQDVSGMTLQGTLTYKLTSNGVLVKEGTGNPGEHVELNADLEEGMNNVAVTVSNDKGSSHKVSVKVWVGIDVPEAVSHLFAGAEANKVTLTWSPSKAGMHGGYVGTLSYDIMRLPDSVKVAENLTDTVFTETIKADNLSSYKYVVTPKNESYAGPPATSNNVVLGSAYEPPYFQDFMDENSLDLFTILDDNGDGNTWVFNGADECVNTSFSDEKGSDDWLITPAIHLSPDKVYTFSFRVHGDGEAWPERMQVTMGPEATPYQYDNVIMPDQEISEMKSRLVRAYVFNTVDRNVHFAFHHDTPAGRRYYGRIYVDSILLESGIDYQAPDSVTNLYVQPGEKGELSATISFKAPTQAIDKSALTSLSEIRVYRADTVLVGKIENPAPGAELSVTDAVGGPKIGKNKYSVVAANDKGDGLIREYERFIGVDIPQTPQNAKLMDEGDYYKAKWDAPTEVGYNGGYVNPDSVFFTIDQVVENPLGGYADGNWLVDSIYGTEVKVEDLNTTDDGYAGKVVYKPNEGQQAFMYLAIKSTNPQGSAGPVVMQTIKGKPYTLPYRESFAGGNLAYDFAWVSYHINNKNYLQITTDSSSDDDGGCLYWTTSGENEYYDFNTGKIAIKGANHPVLMYSYYATPGKKFALTVSAVKPDATVQELEAYDYATLDGKPGWRTSIVDLSALEDNNWLYFRFHLTNNGDETPFALDNINVRDGYVDDLAASVTCPQAADAGDSIPVNVIVRNAGLQAASNYTVKVTVDGAEKEFKGQELQPLAEWHFTYDYPSSINAPKALPVSVEVVAEKDDDLTNNVATDTVVINQPDYDTINDLSASAEGTDVVLNWTAPEKKEAKEVTEGFESYSPWAIDHIGRWTLVDEDGGFTGTFSNMPAFPNVNKPYAYIVMNPEKWGINTEANPFMAAHSGDQYLTTFYCYKTNDQGDYYVDASNWLISPKLSGEAQTVTFYVKDLKNSGTDFPETFDVDYSLSGKDVADFVKLGDTYTVSGGEWTEITVSLPAGARYFAIHHNTAAGQGMMFEIDDVTYTQAASPNIVGFNVYCDGKKVGTVDAANTTYTYAAPDGDSHVYNVTVVYEDGESRYSNDATISTLIKGLLLPDHPFDVYNVSGVMVRKQVRSLQGLQPGVYIVEGRKVIKR